MFKKAKGFIVSTPYRRRSSGILIATALVALAACGGSPSSPNPGGGGGPPPPVTNASVTATAANTFTPSTVNLVVGGTVAFANSGGGLHNVATGNWSCAAGCSDQGGNGAPSTAAWNFTRTFPTVGTVNYVCDEHGGQGMVGSIIVQ